MATIEASKIAIFDAGPILHLDELNCLDLLSDLHERIIPKTVRDEILRHRPSALDKVNMFSISPQNNIPQGESLKTMCQIFSLDGGEIEALAIMEKNPNAILFTDDASARLVANKMGFKVHGTIGIILRAIRQGHRKPEQVIDIFNNIPFKSTLFIKHALLEEIKIKIKDEFQL